MKLPTERLDSDTHTYLKSVETAAGRGFHGVFAQGRRGWFEGPRGGWGPACLAGVALLSVAGLASLPLYLEKVDLNKPAYWQGGLLAAGVGLLLTGIVRFLRKTGRMPARTFVFADALHLWDVQPEWIEAYDLTSLEGVDGQHLFVDGHYDQSMVKLYFPTGSRVVRMKGQQATEDLIGFLQVLGGLRHSGGGGIPQLASATPELLGAVAIRLHLEGANADLTNLDPGPILPVPRDDPPADAPAKLGWGGAVARLAIAAAVGGFALFAFPVLNRHLMEDELFARIPAQDTGNMSALEKYLATYPAGTHADEVRTMLDDRQFARAEKEARQFDRATRLQAYLADAQNTRHRGNAERTLDELDDRLFAKIAANDQNGLLAIDTYRAAFPAGKHTNRLAEALDHRMFADADRAAKLDDNPGPARAYLANTDNTRHRYDAKKLIGLCYDTAIENLKLRAKGTEAKIDPDLFAAIIAMLDTLRDAPDPIVPVGFKATIDAEPATNDLKQREKQNTDQLMILQPELRTIAAQQPGGTPILPRGQVFDPVQIQRREHVILDRLSVAVQKGVKGEILTLRAAESGQVPVLEVAYHISAVGDLYTYTTGISAGFGQPVTNKIAGLLRKYMIEWTITVRPPGTKKVHVCKLGSLPGEQLSYDQRPGDPDWAPYAIILYSGFYDLSARLIQNFALDPGKAPNSFTFDAVASSKANIPGAPPFPGPPNVPHVPPPQIPPLPKG